MAHNAYVGGSLGAWALGTAIPANKMWQIDEAQYKSINGDDGGVWAPTGTITIGGAGLTLTTTATFAAILPTVVITPEVLAGNVVSYGTVTFGNLSQAGTATNAVGGVTTFSSQTVHSGGLDASDSGTVNIGVDATLIANVTLGTATSSVRSVGRLGISQSAASIAADTSVTYLFPTYYRIDSTGGAPRNITLVDTVFTAGSLQIVQNNDSFSQSLTVRDAGAGTLVTLTVGQTGVFIYSGTAWYKVLAA